MVVRLLFSVLLVLSMYFMFKSVGAVVAGMLRGVDRMKCSLYGSLSCGCLVGVLYFYFGAITVFSLIPFLLGMAYLFQVLFHRTKSTH